MSQHTPHLTIPPSTHLNFVKKLCGSIKIDNLGVLFTTLILTLGIWSVPFSSTTSKIIVTRLKRSTICFASLTFGSRSDGIGVDMLIKQRNKREEKGREGKRLEENRIAGSENAIESRKIEMECNH